MDKIPKDRDARLAFLEDWTTLQRWLDSEERRLYPEEIARVLAQARQRTEQVDSLREVGVIPVVIPNPTHLPADRAAVFGDLITGLRKYKWADPIVSECDERRFIAPKAIELARRHRPSAPWLLYMEDDVILGPDFGLLPGLLSEADELFPHTGLVSFFSTLFAEPGWTRHPMDKFGWLQCAAIRNTDHLVGFRAFIDSGVTGSAPDKAVATFLATQYDRYALWCPSLVQHADVQSAFSPHIRSVGSSLSYKLARHYEQTTRITM